MKFSIYTSLFICLPSLFSCTGDFSSVQTNTDIPPCKLQLNFIQGDNTTSTGSNHRSAITGTGTGGNDKISAIGVYVTGSTHQPYEGTEVQNGRYTYVTTNASTEINQTWTCYAGTATSGTATPIFVSTEEATLYAFYPADATVTPGTGNGNHTIPVTNIPAQQTYNGENNWECSATDYLVGSSTETEIIPLTAAIQPEKLSETISKTLYMHHALARVEFQIQNSNGQNEKDYNYVKQITLTVNTGNPPFLATGGANGKMQINNGTFSNLTAVQNLTFTPAGATAQQIPDKGSTLTVVGYGLVAPISAPGNSISLSLLLGKKDNDNDNRTVSVTHESFKIPWLAGHNYVYKLVLNNHILVPSGIEIGELTETVQNDHVLDVN